MAWNELLDAPKKIVNGFTTAAGFKIPDLSGTTGDMMEAAISPQTAVPKMSGRFLASLLSGKQPDGPVGAALNYMGGGGSVSADATQIGPLGVKGLMHPVQQVAVTTPTAPTMSPSHTPGGFIPTMAPSHTPGEVVDVKQPQNAFSGTSPVVMLNGKNLGDTTAISNRVDWTPGGVNASAAEGIAGVNVKPSPFTSYSTQAQTDELGRALPDKTIVRNSVLSNRGVAGLTYDEQVAKAAQVNAAAQRDMMLMSPREQAAAEAAGNANFGAFTRGGAKGDLAAYEARRNAIGEKQKTDAVLEGERIKGEFGMKAKAGDLEIRRLDREAERKSALEVAALKAKENRETALGVTKLKMDESRTERELAAEKELRKGKVELAMPAATTAGTDLETAIAAQEMGLEARGVKKNTFSPNEPAGFYDKKTGKLVDAATIKGMRGKTTGSSAADIAASLRSQGKTAEQIKAELIAQGFKPGTR